MFEQYPMIRYEFDASGSGLRTIHVQDEYPAEKISRTLNPDTLSDYRLRGYVDVLPFYPAAEDDFFYDLHLQSFSYMHSLAGYYTNRKSAESYLLVYTSGGRGKLEYNGTVYHLENNDLFWIDCRQPHTYMTDGTYWEHTDIHMGGNGAGRLYREFLKTGTAAVHLTHPADFLNDVYSLLDHYLSLKNHRSMRIAHQTESMLVHLIMETGFSETETAASSGSLQNLISYMHEHFRQPLTLDQLSDYCGLSKYHLSRQFKKITGLPPNEYLIRLRLENARTLLVNTDYTVRKISEMSGFENEAYFSRIFHNRFHKSPKQYRKETAG